MKKMTSGELRSMWLNFFKKMCIRDSLRLLHFGRKQPVFARKGKGADHIRHISPQHAHDLQAFLVLENVFRRVSVHHRPIPVSYTHLR